MYLIERGTNTKGAMRAGGKMVKVNIINISKERIGIGRLRHPSKTGGVTTGKLLEKMPTIYYHSTTQF